MVAYPRFVTPAPLSRYISRHVDFSFLSLADWLKIPKKLQNAVRKRERAKVSPDAPQCVVGIRFGWPFGDV
jgi:hypothetical protein